MTPQRQWSMFKHPTRNGALEFIGRACGKTAFSEPVRLLSFEAAVSLAKPDTDMCHMLSEGVRFMV